MKEHYINCNGMANYINSNGLWWSLRGPTTLIVTGSGGACGLWWSLRGVEAPPAKPDYINCNGGQLH